MKRIIFSKQKHSQLCGKYFTAADYYPPRFIKSFVKKNFVQSVFNLPIRPKKTKNIAHHRNPLLKERLMLDVLIGKKKIKMSASKIERITGKTKIKN